MSDIQPIFNAIITSRKKPSKKESYLLDRKLAAVLKKGAGKNAPFRFEIGDEVEDFMFYSPALYVGKVIKLYRENGHNRVMTDNKNKPWHREQDLRRVK